MDKIYKDTPYNFSKIEPYIITNVNDIGKEIILADKCYFYDTCSFRNHALITNPNLIYEYIRSTSGIVILTRTVIMELCSNDGCLWDEHIEYIKGMYEVGIKVIVAFEEDFFEVLQTYCSDVAEINKWLSYAVRCAKSKVGSVESVIGQDIGLKKILFGVAECKERKLAETMFKAVRSRKTSGDNMGEELLAICVHWLSRIRDAQSYKYIIFTDDKKSMNIFGKVIKNVHDYAGSNSISVFTTVKLCYIMRLEGIVDCEEPIVRMLEVSGFDDIVKVYCSEEFELAPTEKRMQIEEFAKKVMDGNTKIYY